MIDVKMLISKGYVREIYVDWANKKDLRVWLNKRRDPETRKKKPWINM